ncbi:MAG: hypothetical protein ACOX5G_08510 [Kiritimatiellia bacterium]
MRRTTGWTLKSGNRPILIALDCEEVSELRHGVFRSPSGTVWAQIEVPATQDLLFEDLERELVAALARVELLGQAPRGVTPTEFPPWFLAGLAYLSSSSPRPVQDDFERTWTQWAHGRLPSIAELCSTNGIARDDVAAASQVVGWLFDQRDARGALSRWLRSLARGNPWTPEGLFRDFLGTEDGVLADELWDFWLCRRTRTILEPGTTSPNAIRRFRSVLLTYPSDNGVYLPGFDGIPPERLLAFAGEPWALEAARRRIRTLHMAALGRDERLRKLASLFIGALESFTRGDLDEARSRLSGARRSQQELEIVAATGLTLRTTEPPPAHRSQGEVRLTSEGN